MPIGALGCFGDLAIREAVDVAHDERFEERRGQVGDRLAQALAVLQGDQRLLGIERAVVALARVDRVEIGHVAGIGQGFRPIARHPGHRGVANEREKPRLRPFDGGRFERLQRAQRGVLHDVLGVGRALRQPFGERIGVVEQRRHDFAKPPLRRVR